MSGAVCPSLEDLSFKPSFQQFVGFECDLDLQLNDDSVRGTTQFLRYPGFQKALLEHLKKAAGEKPVRILVAPGSIGCEAYTYAALAADMGFSTLSIDTLDINEHFTTAAREAIYHRGILTTLDISEAFRRHFEEANIKGYMQPRDEAREKVNVLPASDILDFEPEGPYDAVIALNILQHIKWRAENGVPEDFSRICKFVEKLCALSRRLICLNYLINTPLAYNDAMEPFAAGLVKGVDSELLRLDLLDAAFKPVEKSELDRETIIYAHDEHDGIHVFSKELG